MKDRSILELRTMLVLMLAACSFACQDRTTTGPLPRQVKASDVVDSVPQARTTATGCATIEVTITPDRKHVEVETITTAACGGRPLQIVLDTVNQAAIAGNTINFRMVLRNALQRGLTMPARVHASIDSIRGCNDVACARFTNADSAAGGQPSWRYDTLLAPSGAPQFLPPATASRSKLLQLAIDPTIQSVRITLTASAQTGALVAERPPASVPRWIYRDSSFSTGSKAHRFARSVVTVVFRQHATQAQRQQAVDLVAGTVIGGRHLAGGDGYYYVYVPYAKTETDLRAVIQQLRSLPQVEAAGMERPAYLSYLRPNDGTGWQSWAVDRHGYGTEQNWAYESIAAPLAWGCATGDTTAHVGVDDYEFDNTEIAAQTAYGASLLGAHSSDLGFHHGSFSANIIAATGNNSTGMTGMMWRSSLMLAEPDTFSIQAIGAAMDSLVTNGATIVLVNWSETFDDSSLAKSEFYSDFAPALHALTNNGYSLPLLIIPAGNGDSVSATNSGMPVVFSMFPVARDSFPAIVVGASTAARGYASWSRPGSRVDVYAPGVGVYSWNVEGTSANIDSASGTSFAGPFVAGLAGLLKTFDTHLSADSIRRLIDTVPASSADSVTESGGRKAPIINAYASLLRAGQRKGAPLCGNLVYPDSVADIVIERNGATVTDTIQQGDPPYDLLAVLHGGKTIYLVDSSSASTMTWTNTSTWTGPAPNVTAYDTLSGYELSSVNLASWMNHDGDTSIFYNQDGYIDGGCACYVDTNFIQYLYPTGTTNYTLLGTLSQSAIPAGYTMGQATIAYSGLGNQIFIAQSLITSSSATSCQLYSINIASPPQTIQPLGSIISNCSLQSTGFLSSSEDGSTLSLGGDDSTGFSIWVVSTATGSVLQKIHIGNGWPVPMFSPYRTPRRPRIATKGAASKPASSQHFSKSSLH